MDKNTINVVIGVSVAISLLLFVAIVRGITNGVWACVAVLVFPFHCLYTCGGWLASRCRNDNTPISPLLISEE